MSAAERPGDRHQRQRARVRVPGDQQAVRQERVLRGRGRGQGDRRHGAAGPRGRPGRRQAGRRAVRADGRRRPRLAGRPVLRGGRAHRRGAHAALARRRAGPDPAVPAGGDRARQPRCREPQRLQHRAGARRGEYLFFLNFYFYCFSFFV